MINVITNETFSNPYPGLSLAEACHQFELDVTNTINEFQMDLLLTEHSYLCENGMEISYVNEAGDETKEGSSLKEKAVSFLTSIGETINKLWEKLTNWVQDRVDSIREFFNRKGISEKSFMEAKDYLAKNHLEGLKITTIHDRVKYDMFIKGYAKEFKDASYTVKEDEEPGIYKKYTERDESGVVVTWHNIVEAVHVIFGSKEIVRDIRNCQKEANKRIAEAIKRVKAAKGDDMTNEVSRLKAVSKFNSEITKEAVKVYYTYVSNMAATVKTVAPKIKEQKKEAKKNENKSEKKSLFGKGKKEDAGKAEDVKTESSIYF